MANPVPKTGINAGVNLGGAANIHAKVAATAKSSQNNNGEAIQNLNQSYTKNPNNAPTATAKDANQPPQARAKGNGNVNSPPANQEETTAPKGNNLAGKQEPAIGEDAALANRPHRGEDGKSNASTQGLLHGRGHRKGETQTPPPTGETPPIIVNPNDGEGNQTGKTQNTPPIIIFPGENGEQTGKTQNTPPIIVMPNERGSGNHGKHNLPPILTTPNTNQPTKFPPLETNYRVEANLRAHGNQPLGLVRQIVNQILQQNDVYLSRNTINRLVNHQTFQNATQTNLPREVHQLVQNISRQVLALLDNSPQQGKLIHEISKQISHEIRENIQTAKHAILKNADFSAVHFKHLNVAEKMHVAVELMPHHLPPEALENILNRRSPEVVNGLLLARGFVAANEQPANVRNLVASKLAVLPPEISITALRDVGQLVKVLIADTAAARTTANLDLAVQKFVKILMANNEIGVLLATVKLASQTQSQGGLVSRSLALAQIYEMINRLIQAGEKALKDAAPEKNIQFKERSLFQFAGIAQLKNVDETAAVSNKSPNAEAVSGLRQFLEFNPAFVFDNSTSAFNNPDDAREAQKDFVNLYHNDIEAWLKSGNHRFVKEFEFEKPVGVVVERGNEDVFTANTARFVLVRDGSVQGWHFLKSFLVK